MTIDEVFKRATFGHRSILIYEGPVAAHGDWDQDHMLEYHAKHAKEHVELLAESDTWICVEVKNNKS